MADEIDVETNGCTFQWKIENASHCWLKKGEAIVSPTFIADALMGTKWSLRLDPMGDKDENYMSVHLSREEDCSGPDIVEINFQLAFLDKDDSILKGQIESIGASFLKSDDWCFQKFIKRERPFGVGREVFLSQDTLTVQCCLWEGKKPVNPKCLYARTIFEVNRRSFVWAIKKFSILKSDLKDKFKDSLIEFDLVLNEGLDFEKKIAINVNSFNEDIKYFSFKTSIVKSGGEKEYCGTQEYFADDLKRGILCTLLLTKKLMENKSQYLPNDVLSLDCEYICSNGAVLYEHCGCGIISPQLKIEVLESRNEHIKKVEPLNTSVLVNDLKSMYNDGIFSDTVLRTTIQTFRAHKAILGARSPVFRNMFGNDMKEKYNGDVDITDLEEDTIHRMLLYLYTDSLEDLQFESASKLYAAADKYQILSLKSRCSSFLIENLCPTNACDVLVFCNQHHNEDLKTAVHDYVLKQGRDFFCSQEWEHFMQTHKELAMHLMFLKLQRPTSNQI